MMTGRRARTFFLLLISLTALTARSGRAETLPQRDDLQSDLSGLDPAAVDEARRSIVEDLHGVGGTRERILTIAQIAYGDDPDPVRRAVARVMFQTEGLASAPALNTVFLRGSPEAQVAVFNLYLDNWSWIGQGTDPWRTELVRRGVNSADRQVRRAAARLAANRPLERVGHIMVDAAMDDPELELAALLTLDVNRDSKPVRWAIEKLFDDDPRIRAGAFRAIQSIGRPAAKPLVERLSASDAQTGATLIEALLTIAVPDDGSVLYDWLDKQGASYAELADRVTRTLAALEIGNYKPDRLPRPDLTFPD